MKRVVLLILVILMLIDLGEDGCLGKAKFVPPQSFAETSLTSPLLDCSGKVDSHYKLPPGCWEISRLMQFQMVTQRVQPVLKIIIYNNNGSSGGIPL
jgi:hypothetical protein